MKILNQVKVKKRNRVEKKVQQHHYLHHMIIKIKNIIIKNIVDIIRKVQVPKVKNIIVVKRTIPNQLRKMQQSIQHLLFKLRKKTSFVSSFLFVSLLFNKFNPENKFFFHVIIFVFVFNEYLLRFFYFYV